MCGSGTFLTEAAMIACNIPANINRKGFAFEKWHDLVQAFTQHCVDRYGMDEVLTWYFEVWNEPNLYPLFWDGTKAQYFELYKQSALAVKSVDKRLKIGGPSTSNFVPDTRFDGEITDDEVSEAVFNTEDITKNLYQVTNQITQEGTYKNRYDVTLLVNGLPLVFIELKNINVKLADDLSAIEMVLKGSYPAFFFKASSETQGLIHWTNNEFGVTAMDWIVGGSGE
jgi:type I site-specific restriction-modification system R (restriction) subunit